MGAVVFDFNKRLQQKQEEITAADLDHIDELLKYITPEEYEAVSKLPQAEAIIVFKKLLYQAEFRKNKSKFM